MAADLKIWQPDWAVPPGEILSEALAERGMTQAELARRTNRPLKTINQIIKGKASITAETALQLEKVLGVAARFWLNLESGYGEALARERERNQLPRTAKWAERFPVNALVQRGVMSRDSRHSSEDQLLRFFAVSSPAGWERQWGQTQADFRQSPAFASEPEAVSAWLRIGELVASKIETLPYNEEHLRAALPEIRSLIGKEPIAFLPRLRDILAKCGVAFALVQELPGTHISGATRWLGPDRALIQLSLRHRNDDQFWLALFHEVQHLLSGVRRPNLDSPRELRGLNPDELQMDQLADRLLLSNDDYAELIALGDLSPTAIRTFARRVSLTPGILVGRLQRGGRLAPSKFNSLKRAVRFPEEAYRMDHK
jgi:HTH-type transcriptional regulator/antitoxin HigA